MQRKEEVNGTLAMHAKAAFVFMIIGFGMSWTTTLAQRGADDLLYWIAFLPTAALLGRVCFMAVRDEYL